MVVHPVFPSIQSVHIIPFLRAENELSQHFWSIQAIFALIPSYTLSAVGGGVGSVCVKLHSFSLCQCVLLFLIVINVMCVVLDIHPVTLLIALRIHNVHILDPETGWVCWSARSGQ